MRPSKRVTIISPFLFTAKPQVTPGAGNFCRHFCVVSADLKLHYFGRFEYASVVNEFSSRIH